MVLTDKLVLRWLEGFGAWSLDRATTFPSVYPAHASGLSGKGVRRGKIGGGGRRMIAPRL
jgi:hypothetical protein